jgi:hypothetical protein
MYLHAMVTAIVCAQGKDMIFPRGATNSRAPSAQRRTGDAAQAMPS